MRKQRLSWLMRAKTFTLSGYYSDALSLLEKILRKNSKDIDALRLKGNVLDLWKGGEGVNESDKALMADRALKCYQEILSIEPANILALIDMGDYCRRHFRLRDALIFYDEAISLLEKGEYYLSLEDEMEEAVEGKELTLSLIAESKVEG